MSCFPETTYAFYVDGELSAEELHPVEAHLVSCRRCRELVVALRDEADLLTATLRDPAPSAQLAKARPAPARGLVIGLVPILAASALLTVGVGWLVDVAWPVSRPLLRAFDIGGIYDMAFDLVYLVRDEAPAAFEVALAVAAMASVSALLSFALTIALRRWSGPTLLALSVLLAIAAAPDAARAHFGLHEHRDYTLAEGEVHDGTLFAHGDNVTIDGVVEGDLLAFTRRLVVRGEVRGNVIALARDSEFTGEVTGTLHVASRLVRIVGRVGGNLYAFGAEGLEIEPDAHIGRDVAAGGEEVYVEGSVGRDLFVGGDRVELRGHVTRNVHAWAESLGLLAGSSVGGDVDAVLPRGQEIEIADGARVAGESSSRVLEHRRDRGFAKLADPHFYGWLALHVGAAFVVGMVLHLVLPGLFGGHLETTGAFFRSLGLGFAVAVLVPIGLAAVAMTLIGVPLALMGAALYLAGLYVSIVLVAFLIGRSVVHPSSDAWTAFGMALLVGLVIVVFATHFPYVGGPLRVVTVLTGVGLLLDRARQGWPTLRPLQV
ncbi:MAG: zf-HC2 domain-containing protein [Myxococcota bacterium]|nr:zf-HC2 domain-containing protein [Myxococcota bacterium]